MWMGGWMLMGGVGMLDGMDGRLLIVQVFVLAYTVGSRFS